MKALLGSLQTAEDTPFSHLVSSMGFERDQRLHYDAKSFSDERKHLHKHDTDLWKQASSISRVSNQEEDIC